MDAGNWNTANTEKRVENLLRRPTIQKLFEGYYYDYSREKHKYEHFEQNSEQSWYLDSKGNIKHGGDKGEDKQKEGSDFGKHLSIRHCLFFYKDAENENMIGDKEEEKIEEAKEDDKLSL